MTILKRALTAALVALPAAVSAQRVDTVAAVLVEGVVLDASGNPLSGAEVSLPGGEQMPVITDSAGRFQLTVAGFGDRTLQLRRSGFIPEERPIRLTCRLPQLTTAGSVITCPETPERLVVALQPFRFTQVTESALHGVVYNVTENRPVVGAILWLDRSNRAVSDVDGSFRFGPIESGVHYVTVEALGFFRERRLLIVQCDEVRCMSTGAEMRIELRNVPGFGIGGSN